MGTGWRWATSSGEVHAADPDGLAFGLKTLREAISLVPDLPLQDPSLVLERIGASDQGVRRILNPV